MTESERKRVEKRSALEKKKAWDKGYVFGLGLAAYQQILLALERALKTGNPSEVWCVLDCADSLRRMAMMLESYEDPKEKELLRFKPWERGDLAAEASIRFWGGIRYESWVLDALFEIWILSMEQAKQEKGHIRTWQKCREESREIITGYLGGAYESEMSEEDFREVLEKWMQFPNGEVASLARKILEEFTSDVQ